MNKRWYDTEYAIENSSTQVLGSMSCSLTNFENNLILSIIYGDEDELIEIECFLDINTIYIVDKEFTLGYESLNDSNCINGITRKTLIVSIFKYFNDKEFEYFTELNNALNNFLKEITNV